MWKVPYEHVNEVDDECLLGDCEGDAVDVGVGGGEVCVAVVHESSGVDGAEDAEALARHRHVGRVGVAGGRQQGCVREWDTAGFKFSAQVAWIPDGVARSLNLSQVIQLSFSVSEDIEPKS